MVLDCVLERVLDRDLVGERSLCRRVRLECLECLERLLRLLRVWRRGVGDRCL